MIIKKITQEFEGTIKEFGDFQTPSSLVERICQLLKHKNIKPTLIVEPTCGEGKFIEGALKAFPSVNKVYALEVQNHYIEKCANRIQQIAKTDLEVSLFHSNFFEHDFKDLTIHKETLMLGNPPWVTSAELTEKTGWNLPVKSNFKTLVGFDAITGKSNFDITEVIMMNLLDKMDEVKSGTLAMLCKKAVIKNIIEYQRSKNWSISAFEAYEIDAKKEFNVAVEAALLFVQFEDTEEKVYQCKYFNLCEPLDVKFTMGWVGEKFVSNVGSYHEVPNFDGKCELVWRSGIKHDCSHVMELKKKEDLLVNGLSEEVNIEEEMVFSLMKSSDVAQKRINRIDRRKVIVTQKAIGEDTSYIEKQYPKLWNYLVKHSDKLDNRKSSVYHNGSRFSIFGVGDYSFSPYKVAISGMYKAGHFLLIGPDDHHKPVMLDDTCYFLSFSNEKDAAITAAILNSEMVQQFFQTIIFKDAKRPYNKKVLMRINLYKALVAIGTDHLIKAIEQDYHLLVNECEIETYMETYLLPNEGRVKNFEKFRELST